MTSWRRFRQLAEVSKEVLQGILQLGGARRTGFRQCDVCAVPLVSFNPKSPPLRIEPLVDASAYINGFEMVLRIHQDIERRQIVALSNEDREIDVRHSLLSLGGESCGNNGWPLGRNTSARLMPSEANRPRRMRMLSRATRAIDSIISSQSQGVALARA